MRSWTRWWGQNAAGRRRVRASTRAPIQDLCYSVRCTFPRDFEECEGPEPESLHSGLLFTMTMTDRVENYPPYAGIAAGSTR
jgi:hypothetical protein